MNPPFRFAHSLLLLPLITSATLAQKSEPQKSLSVLVVNAHTNPGLPVPSVRVSLSYLDGNSRVIDARDVTNSKGEAGLQVSAETSQHNDLRIEVTGAQDLAIYQPADGQLTGLPPSVKVALLPKGSPALMGSPQIEATLRRLSSRSSSLERQNRALQGALAAAQAQKDDLAAAVAEWAKANGFPDSEAEKKIKEWAEDIQRQSQKATDEQKALAQFALKNYNEAAKLFDDAAENEDEAFAAHKKQVKEQLRQEELQSLRSSLTNSERSANSYRLNAHYDLAANALSKAFDRLTREQKDNAEDPDIANLWLSSLRDLASARVDQAKAGDPAKSKALLAEASKNFDQLSTECLARNDTAGWARAQSGIGIILLVRADRTDGGPDLYTDALTVISGALKPLSKQDQPAVWGRLQNNLALVYTHQALRTTDDAPAIAFLLKARNAYAELLTVYTRESFPQEWALTQRGLATALATQGTHTAGQQGIALLEESVKASERATEISTRADQPNEWASIEMNLADVRLKQGDRSRGRASVAFYGQAAEDYAASLQVFTRETSPQWWAWSTQGMGIAYAAQGEHSAPAEAGPFFDKALAAYTQVLEVYTLADVPDRWQRVQKLIATIYVDRNDLPGAAIIYEASLKALPNNRFAMEGYSGMLHDNFFDFPRAYDMDVKLEALDHNLDYRMNLLEASLTADRFKECLQMATTLEQTAAYTPVRQVLKLACEWGIQDKPAAHTAAQALAQSRLTPGGWGFAGTLHYLQLSPTFAPGRDAWLALFTAVQNGDAPAMTTALQQLDLLFQPNSVAH